MLRTKLIHTTTATGLTLEFEPPEGRPSTDGTVTVFDPRYAFDDAVNNPIVTGTATREAVDTTLTAAAGASQANPRNLPMVAPAALAVGEFVIVENAAKQRERVTVRKIAAAAVEIEEPLVFEYATSDTVVSAKMASPAIPDAFLQDEDNLAEHYFARWTYTVDGVTTTATTRWDLVREPFRSNVQDSHLLDRYPDLLRVTSFKNHPATLKPIIAEATRDVMLDITKAGYDPDRVRGGEIVDRLVVYKSFELVSMIGSHPPDRDVEEYKTDMVEQYAMQRNDLINQRLKIPYDVTKTTN